MKELFRAENIHKHFDGIYALEAVNFEIFEGEVHALIGENGAGKSTLGKIIAGVLPADEGELFFNGNPVVIGHPQEARSLGIGIIFQELDLFPHLSVAENIVIGNSEAEKDLFVRSRKLHAFAKPFMLEAGLECGPGSLLGELPIGQQQLAAIARALSMHARLIVMDEPTSSLSDNAVENLFVQIRRLRDQGVSIIYVSHKMDEILAISDRITVLRDGKLAGTRTAGKTSAYELISMMVGRELKDGQITTSPKTREILSVRNLNTSSLADISFDLHQGEILGIAGLVGSGRSELGAALFGLDRIHSGSIEISGKPISPRTPSCAIACGIGLLPEDRKTQGLMMQMSVKENCSISVLDRLNVLGVIRRKTEDQKVRDVCETTGIRSAGPDVPVSTLSGGNQQKILLSRWILADPDILFLDDPTRGIDVGTKQDIYRLIEDMALQGKGILFVSSELPELIRCCHRILVLHEGRIRGSLTRDEATQEKIMALAMKAAG